MIISIILFIHEIEEIEKMVGKNVGKWIVQKLSIFLQIFYAV